MVRKWVRTMLVRKPYGAKMMKSALFIDDNESVIWEGVVGNTVYYAVTKMAAVVKQGKRWCFTLNNYTNEEWLHIVAKMTSKDVKYCVIGEEVGENGTVHLQGYVRYTKKTRMAGVKKTVGMRAHVETCRGSEEENKMYCVKDGKVLLEVGIYNTSIGRRGCPASMSDNVIALIDFLKSGKKIEDIEPEHYLTFVRYGNMIMKLVNAHIMKRQMNEIKETFETVTWKEWQVVVARQPDGKQSWEEVVVARQPDGKQSWEEVVVARQPDGKQSWEEVVVARQPDGKQSWEEVVVARQPDGKQSWEEVVASVNSAISGHQPGMSVTLRACKCRLRTLVESHKKEGMASLRA